MESNAVRIFEAAKADAFRAIASKHVLGGDSSRNAVLFPLSECPSAYQNEPCCCCASTKPIGVMQIPMGAEDAFFTLICADCWELRQGGINDEK